MKLKDLTGLRFGHLTVLKRGKTRNKRTYWFCQCDCGGQSNIQAQHLVNGTQVSCGCFGRQYARQGKPATTHGRRYSLEWRSWMSAKQRCFNRKHQAYKNYGGRGITMCEEWKNDFARFYSDMGVRPKGFTLDRINNDGNYEPGNCRWADRKTQRGNTRQ